MVFKPLVGLVLATAAGTALAQAAAPPAAGDAGARLLQRYDDTLQVWVNDRSVKGYVQLKLKAVAKVWTLMGEPVVYCSAAWSLVGTNLQAEQRNQWHYLLPSSTPREVFDGIGLVQATVAFPLYRKGQSYRETPVSWVPCDLGAMNGNGDPKGSFNVPGSPDWSRFLMVRNRHGDRPWNDPAQYLPAAEAKALLASGQYEFRAGEGGRLNDGAALRFEFNLSSVRSWLAEQQAQQEADKLAERRRQREEREAIIRRNRAQQPGAASEPARAADPFDAMVAELDSEAVTRAERAEKTRISAERSRAAEGHDQRRRALAHKGCVDTALTAGIDLEAAALQAEQAHARCASTVGVTAFVERTSGTSLYGYKRPDGSVLIAPQFEVAQNFSDGLGRVRGGPCTAVTCYVNAAGNIVLSTEYTGGDFHEGLASMYVRGQGGGYMDRSGRMVIPARFSRAQDFKDGSAAVELHRRTSGEDTCTSRSTVHFSAGRINAQGQWVEGPSDDTRSGPGRICLTRVPNR